MERKKPIVSYSANEIAEQRKRGKDLTDWQRVDRLTEAELDAAIADDADADTGPIHWDTVEIASSMVRLGTLYPQIQAGINSGPGIPADEVFSRLEEKLTPSRADKAT